jgi:F-type H+-transporting ATPase subunit delta
LAPEGYKKTLEAYRDLVQRCLGQQQATLEHAGTLSPHALSALQAQLKIRYPAATPQLVCKPNPALLAGWRLRVGDDVWAYSVADALQAPLPAIRMPSS